MKSEHREAALADIVTQLVRQGPRPRAPKGRFSSPKTSLLPVGDGHRSEIRADLEELHRHGLLAEIRADLEALHRDGPPPFPGGGPVLGDRP
ncbi:hypothetical protein [Kineosporia sp. NBRC 101731]|uniref:hypothetical protein n=1 Tax=Kineosporia sp. NBRC 101731 TaxID=3032199 RepID=UPI0024A552E0|nr:hypothetical protein [Kineosporia sp. NBRC 101731]GLY28886.1 hypothetical protein Kisp02_22510 [Kineosporia sp. NBRC 101731]